MGTSKSLSPLDEGLRAWQPIETDTNDGECVLVWWPEIDDRFPLIAWQKHGVWRSYDVVNYTVGPTHWMPLPSPPDAALARRREDK